MKKFRNAAVGLVVIGFTLVLTLCTYYNINMGKVSKDSTPKEVTIKAGSINSIATTLKTYYSDKEGAPDTIKVTVSKDADPVIDPTAQTPLKDTGLETTRLKGTKWNGNIDITYTSATGKITYSASSDYYTATGTDDQIKPKN